MAPPLNESTATATPTARAAGADDGPQAAPELTIVVPTFGERANVAVLIDNLRRVLDGCDWEVIVVDDDSADGTAAAVRAIGEHDRRVRCIRRIGRRGLAGACLEGMLASQASFVAVMDADLQHDEALLRPMLDHLRAGEIDLVVASRYLAGGSASAFSATRGSVSRLSTAIARRFLAVHISDPLSGFFMIRRPIIDDIAPSLSSQGFKILLDILATAGSGLRVVELPYVFRQRGHGESKFDTAAALDFAALVAAKLTRQMISFRFLLFCLVGLTGIGVHMAALLIARAAFGLRFGIAQTLATVLAIAWNFVLNNALTYRDQRLAGWQFVGGLLRFEIICAVGAVSNVGIASSIYAYDRDWWIAGLGGALMGAVWNYAVSMAFVWRGR